MLDLTDAVTVHLVRVDPTYAQIVRAVGPFEPRPPSENAFGALLRAIVFQQLAGRAANAIHGRFVALYAGQPTATAILDTTPEQLRAVGLSGNKSASIRDLALKASDGTLPIDHLHELSDDEIIERLITVRGIGRWTAEMFLLFQLRRPDVWPVGDFGVRKGYAVIHNLPTPPTPKVLDGLGEIYRPYRSAAAWYCWRAVDTVLPTA